MGDIGDFEVKAHRSAVWKHEAEVLERQKHKCASCNEVMMNGWSLHRKTPRSMGGRDSSTIWYGERKKRVTVVII